MRNAACLLALLLGAGLPAAAHHSIAAVYDSSKPVTVEGVITRFAFVNPHPFIELTSQDQRGEALQWRLELDNLGELRGIGISAATFKAGDRVVVTGSQGRSEPRALYVRRLQRPSDGFEYEQVGASPRIRSRP